MLLMNNKKYNKKANNKKTSNKLITCYHAEIVILLCFRCLFKTIFSQVIFSGFLSFNLREDEEWSTISKYFSSQTFLQLKFSTRCCKVRDLKSISKCYLIISGK